MNEQAIKDAYNLFVQEGYKKDINSFKELMQSNEQARQDAHQLFVDNGYKKSITDFSMLMGANDVKKKDEAVQNTNATASSSAGIPSASSESIDAIPTLNMNIGGASMMERFGANAPKGAGPANVAPPPTEQGLAAPRQQVQKEVAATQANIADKAFKAKMPQLEAQRKQEEALQEQKRKEEITSINSNPEFTSLINTIDKPMMAKTEEQLVPELVKKFGRYGFTFEEAGAGTNAITVRSANGEGELTIPVGSHQIYYGPDLRDFIKQHAADYKKDLNSVEKAGQDFYAQRGLDYIAERHAYDEYVKTRDKVDAINSEKGKVEADKKVVAKYPELFVNGRLRSDYNEILDKLNKKKDVLFADVYGNEDAMKAREDFDLQLQKWSDVTSKEYAAANQKLNQQKQELDAYVQNTFGVTLDKLPTVKPTTPEQQQAVLNVQAKTKEIQALQSLAATKYEATKTFFNEKVNKNISKDFDDNLTSVYNSLMDAADSQAAGKELIFLKAKMISGKTDIADIQEAADIIAYYNQEHNSESRILTRKEFAKGAEETFAVFKKDPVEYMAALVASSMGQLLPYGTEILLSAATGATYGAITASAAAAPTVVGTAPAAAAGAVAGFAGGLTAGMSAANAGMEYTGALLDAITKHGYDLKDAQSVQKALQDPSVWKEGEAIGVKRGLTIAVVDAITGSLAGNLFHTSELAGKGTKILAQVAERGVADPVFEGGGEYLAQVVSGQKGSMSDVVDEAMGALGSKTPNMALNLLSKSINNSTQDLAANLTSTNYISQMKESNEKILSWADNMKKLGKIKESTYKAINDNVTARKTADDILGSGGGGSDERAKVRMMELIKAKNDLSSSPERKEVFAEQIGQISDEIKKMAASGEVVAFEERADLDAMPLAKNKITTKTETNAVQEQATDEGVLRTEQPQVGLQEVGQGNAEAEVATQEGAQTKVEPAIAATDNAEPLTEADRKDLADEVSDLEKFLNDKEETEPDFKAEDHIPSLDENGDFVVTFGKFAGKKFSETPAKFQQWLRTESYYAQHLANLEAEWKAKQGQSATAAAPVAAPAPVAEAAAPAPIVKAPAPVAEPKVETAPVSTTPKQEAKPERIVHNGQDITKEKLRELYQNVKNEIGKHHVKLSPISYEGQDTQIKEAVDYYNEAISPYDKQGKLKQQYMNKVVGEALDKIPFKQFATLYRKHIDPYFTAEKYSEALTESRKYNKKFTFQDLAGYIIGDKTDHGTEEQFRNFAKSVGIEIPEGNPIAPKIEAAPAQQAAPIVASTDEATNTKAQVMLNILAKYKPFYQANRELERLKRENADINQIDAQRKVVANAKTQIVNALKGLNIPEKNVQSVLESVHLEFRNILNGASNPEQYVDGKYKEDVKQGVKTSLTVLVNNLTKHLAADFKPETTTETTPTETVAPKVEPKKVSIYDIEELKDKFPRIYNKIKADFPNAKQIDLPNFRNMYIYYTNQLGSQSANEIRVLQELMELERLMATMEDVSKKTSTKKEVIDLIDKSNYTRQQKAVLKNFINSLKTETLGNFQLPDKNVRGNQNHYRFFDNLIRAADAEAFMHEFGHWAFFNVLSSEDRMEFYQYCIDRFTYGDSNMADETVLLTGLRSDDSRRALSTNATETFDEYWANQWDQYLLTGLAEEKIKYMLIKMKEFFINLLNAYKSKGYNPELTKYFDKLIDREKFINLNKEGTQAAETKAAPAATTTEKVKSGTAPKSKTQTIIGIYNKHRAYLKEVRELDALYQKKGLSQKEADAKKQSIAEAKRVLRVALKEAGISADRVDSLISSMESVFGPYTSAAELIKALNVAEEKKQKTPLVAMAGKITASIDEAAKSNKLPSIAEQKLLSSVKIIGQQDEGGDFILNVGKHKGMWFSETPTPYQQWLKKQDWFQNELAQMQREKLQKEYERQQAESKAPKQDLRTEEKAKKADTVDEVQDIVDEMNAIETGNANVTVNDKEGKTKLSVASLSKSLGKKIKTVKLAFLNKIPVLFTITDQLRSGDVTNPFTGKVITNLKGGVGFNYTEGNTNLAWANTRESEAQKMAEKANSVYLSNKEFYDKFWKENPQYNGLVIMPVIKMGENSMLSNEAVARVLYDNVASFPQDRKVAALNHLVENRIPEKIKSLEKTLSNTNNTESTLKNAQKSLDGYNALLQFIKDNNIKAIDELIKADVFTKLSLPARATIISEIATGEPNKPREASKKSNIAGKGRVGRILLGVGLDAEAPKVAQSEIDKLSLSAITDILTEPTIKDAPIRSVVAVQGIQVLDSKGNYVGAKVEKTTHPNYPYGVVGQPIGIIEDADVIQNVYPEAFNKAVKGLVKEESKKKVYTSKESKEKGFYGQLKQASMGTILASEIPVQVGLTNEEFISAIANTTQTEATKIANFLNLAFPNVTFSLDQATWDNLVASGELDTKVSKGRIIYGVTKSGNIYINPAVHFDTLDQVNTLVHEFGHVWQDYLLSTEKGKEIYKKGEALIKEAVKTDKNIKAIYDKQLKKFEGNEAKALREVMAILIGNKGQAITDASLRSKFQEFLVGMWNYIASKFKLSEKLTAKEIQNLTLDQFLGTALRDMFKGEALKGIEKMEKKLDVADADIMFRATQSMKDIIDTARSNGFSDSSIREVLKKKGFEVKDINEAMKVKVNESALRALPKEFGDVKGGVIVGNKLFLDVATKVQEFASRPNKDGKYPTMSEIREVAMEMLKDNDIFKQQDVDVQNSLVLAFDRVINTTANKTVQNEINRIRTEMKNKKYGAELATKFKNDLRKAIKEQLSKIDGFTPNEVARLNKIVAETTKDNMEASLEKVKDILEAAQDRLNNEAIAKQIAAVRQTMRDQKRGEQNLRTLQAYMKNMLRATMPVANYTRGEIKKILAMITSLNAKDFSKTSNKVSMLDKVDAFVKKKIKTAMLAKMTKLGKKAKTTSNKVRSNGLDSQGQSFFNTAAKLLKASLKNDVNTINEMAQKLSNSQEVNEAVAAYVNNEELTSKQQNILDVMRAFSLFGNINNMEIPDLQDLAKSLEDERSASIARLDNNIQLRSAYLEDLKNKAYLQIAQAYPALFDSNGQLKSSKILEQDQEAIWKMLKSGNFFEAAKRFTERIDFQSTNKLRQFFRSNLMHLGTLTEILDGGVGTFFKEQFYERLNKAHSAMLGGIFKQQDVMDGVAKQLGIEKGFRKLFKELGNVEPVEYMHKGAKHILSGGQMARVYALSLNSRQKDILATANSIDDAVLEKIKEKLGPKNIAFIEEMVNYLSSDYFNSINDVYRKIFNVDLNFIANYFPTESEHISDSADAVFLGDMGNRFLAENQSALKARANVDAEINTSIDFRSALEHYFSSMERFKAYAEDARVISSLMADEHVKTVLQETHTASIFNLLVANSISPESKFRIKNDLAGFLYAALTGSALLFKPLQFLKQASSIFAAVADYKYTENRALKPLDYIMWTMDTAKVLMRPAKYMKMMMELSPDYKERLRSLRHGDLLSLESGLYRNAKAYDENLAQELHDTFKKWGGVFMLAGDTVSTFGYIANYMRDLENGMSKEDALAKFNNYNAALQSRRNTEKVALQYNNNMLAQGSMLFMTAWLANINKIAVAQKRVVRDSMNLKMPKSKDLRALVIHGVVLGVLSQVIQNIGLFGSDDDDDKQKGWDAVIDASMGLDLIYQTPLLGAGIQELVAYAEGKQPNRKAGYVNPVMKLVEDVYKGVKEDDVYEELKPIMSLLLGFSPDPFKAAYDYFSDSEDSTDNILEVLGFAKSYRPTKGEINKELLKMQSPDLYKSLFENDAAKQMEEMKNAPEKMLNDKRKEAFGYSGERRKKRR